MLCALKHSVFEGDLQVKIKEIAKSAKSCMCLFIFVGCMFTSCIYIQCIQVWQP